MHYEKQLIWVHLLGSYTLRILLGQARVFHKVGGESRNSPHKR